MARASVLAWIWDISSRVLLARSIMRFICCPERSETCCTVPRIWSISVRNWLKWLAIWANSSLPCTGRRKLRSLLPEVRLSNCCCSCRSGRFTLRVISTRVPCTMSSNSRAVAHSMVRTDCCRDSANCWEASMRLVCCSKAWAICWLMVADSASKPLCGAFIN